VVGRGHPVADQHEVAVRRPPLRRLGRRGLQGGHRIGAAGQVTAEERLQRAADVLRRGRNRLGENRPGFLTEQHQIEIVRRLQRPQVRAQGLMRLLEFAPPHGQRRVQRHDRRDRPSAGRGRGREQVVQQEVAVVRRLAGRPVLRRQRPSRQQLGLPPPPGQPDR